MARVKATELSSGFYLDASTPKNVDACFSFSDVLLRPLQRPPLAKSFRTFWGPPTICMFDQEDRTGDPSGP